LPYHPGIDVGAVRELADRQSATIAVECLLFAGELLPADIIAQLACGTVSASPGCTPSIGAGLRALRRVDALEADVRVVDDDSVAVDDPGLADDGAGRRGVPVLVCVIA
jgi:hypothetical protein